MRNFLITAILAVALAAGAAWYFDLWQPGEDGGDDAPAVSVNGESPKPPSVDELGNRLYKVEGAEDEKHTPPPPPTANPDPIVIPNCHLVVFDKKKVPSPREGVLLFVGKESTLDLAAGGRRLMMLTQPYKKVEMDDENIALWGPFADSNQVDLKDRIVLAGKAPGAANLKIWTDDPKSPGNELIHSYTVRVYPAPRAKTLKEQIQELGFDYTAPIDQSKLGQTARILQGNDADGDDLVLVKTYQPWRENMVVDPGEMLAMVNPALAMKELDQKKVQINMAKEAYKSAKATYDEANLQYQLALRVNSGFSTEERRIKELTAQRHLYDQNTKLEEIKLAVDEANKARIVLGQHTIYNKMFDKAIIKHIYRKGSESIKALEDILELHNIGVLRAEGTIGSEQRSRLKKGMKVSIEPLQEQPPFRQPFGHNKGVTSVAFSNSAQGDPLIVSASEDQTVRIWQLYQDEPIGVWPHPKAVHVVVCSPAKSKKDLVLSGCEDGKVRLWDLSKLDKGKKALLWEKEVPGAAPVKAVAFSPDGNFFATGGDDGSIHIWDAVTRKHRYEFELKTGVTEPHQGSITTLHFTPQCRLISASKDNTIRVWDLYEKGATLATPPITDRSGAVTQLGVSKNGKWVLFDKGRELQLLSAADGRPKGLLKNLIPTSFETLAIFSPDPNASLMLTAGAPEGRLQLWRTPIEGQRPFEVRQWVAREKSPVTCAAFAPSAGGAESSFAVTGTKDGYLYIWEVPSRAEVDSHPIKNLTLEVDPALESGRQIQVGITIPNPDLRFDPGGIVHVVIEE